MIHSNFVIAYFSCCLQQKRLRMISILGAGLLVGTALAVIIPEGVHALYESQEHGELHCELRAGKKKLELQLVLWASSCHILLVVANDLVGEWLSLASHTDVLRGLSPVPAPQTSAEPKDKFLSHCLQKYQLVITWRLSEIQSALLKSKCWQAKHIHTSSVECDTWPKIFAAGKNLGDKRWVFVYFSL